MTFFSIKVTSFLSDIFVIFDELIAQDLLIANKMKEARKFCVREYTTAVKNNQFKQTKLNCIHPLVNDKREKVG